jgi:hypothetical protein
LKSATTNPAGTGPAKKVDVENAKVVAGALTVNDAALDVPPPGAGLETVTLAVPADARTVAGTVACS